MSTLKKIWADPVWSKVIAQGIIGAIGVTAAALLIWWPPAMATASRLVGFLTAYSEVQNWLVGLGAACILLASLAAVGLAWSIMFPRQDKVPWLSYTSDSFEGLRWNWRLTASGEVSDLYPLCERCSYEVRPHNESHYDAAPRFGFRCDVCRREVGPFGGEPIELKERIIRLIRMNVRTGEWRKAIPHE